ncbi:porin family protein [Massilia sp. ST3]|uniref:porin family protein n=1 Tax=Massilia sp. ST3 TaxID=2824903 RepID=UPI001B82E203|nr:porin family protein [Massilia sp. ST3]MBQ5949765.1 porin family protein [Massilia sp. ST3]
MKKLIIALVATTAAMGAAQAQSLAGKAYVGAAAATAKNQTADHHKADGKLYAGYNFDEKMAVEAGVTNFHSTDFRRGAIAGSTEGNSSYVAAKYTMPVNEKLSAYGKLGLSHSERKLSTNAGGRYKEDDTGAYGGLGLEYKLNQNVALTAEYERYGKDKSVGAKADVWSAGVKYGF